MKRTLIELGKVTAAVVWLVALVCNTAWPVYTSHGEYAIFNLVACGLGLPTVIRWIKHVRSGNHED